MQNWELAISLNDSPEELVNTLEVYFQCSLNLFLEHPYKRGVKKLTNANTISDFEILIKKYT